MPALPVQTPQDTYNKKLILAGFIILIVVHIIFTFSGFYGSDDINYARYAADIALNGVPGIPATNHFQLRWSTIYSTAFFYRIFGINAFTSTLSSALSFILCGFILYKILVNQKTVVYLLSMTLFFFAHSIIFYMHRLLPDSVMCLAVLWMYYSYRTFSHDSKKPLLYGVSFSVAFLFGIVTKETIVIVLPLYLILLSIDLFKKRHIQFWKYGIGFSVLLVSLYLLFFKITTNDFLFRYHLLQSKGYQNICSFDSLPFIYTLQRIGYELWKAMLLNGDFLVLLPAIGAALYKNKLTGRGINKVDILSFIILLVCTNFMTISFTHYVPLCHDPRHFIFLFPFAAVLGGPMLYAYFKEPLKFIFLPLLFIAATIVMFILHAGTTKYLYLLFALLLSGHYVVSLAGKTLLVYKVAIGLLIALMSLNYIIDFVKPLYPFYWDHKKIIENNFSTSSGKATVFCSDDLSAELSEYFLQFKTGNIKYYPLDSIKHANEGALYYFLNGDLDPVARGRIDSLLKEKTGPQVVIIDQVNNVSLYKVHNDFLQFIKEQ